MVNQVSFPLPLITLIIDGLLESNQTTVAFHFKDSPVQSKIRLYGDSMVVPFLTRELRRFRRELELDPHISARPKGIDQDGWTILEEDDFDPALVKTGKNGPVIDDQFLSNLTGFAIIKIANDHESEEWMSIIDKTVSWTDRIWKFAYRIRPSLAEMLKATVTFDNFITESF